MDVGIRVDGVVATSLGVPLPARGAAPDERTERVHAVECFEHLRSLATTLRVDPVTCEAAVDWARAVETELRKCNTEYGNATSQQLATYAIAAHVRGAGTRTDWRSGTEAMYRLLPRDASSAVGTDTLSSLLSAAKDDDAPTKRKLLRRYPPKGLRSHLAVWLDSVEAPFRAIVSETPAIDDDVATAPRDESGSVPMDVCSMCESGETSGDDDNSLA